MYYIFICGCEIDNLKVDWSLCNLCMIYYFYSPNTLPKICFIDCALCRNIIYFDVFYIILPKVL
jgi:hypothetical protein